MFSSFKNFFSSVYRQVTERLTGLFARHEIDETALHELERILLTADVGLTTTRRLLDAVKAQMRAHQLRTGADLKRVLQQELLAAFTMPTVDVDKPVQLLVGINGSGKTTVAGKLAYKYTQQGKKVLLVAADTFRAAATDQLAQWAQRTGAALVQGAPGQDPASVVFAGAERFVRESFDYVIIDTAGRLQTKINLMHELAKIKRILLKHIPADKVITMLTIDAMLGQNSLQQAQLFHESTQLDGIILTKTDGTGKGGIVCAIAADLKVPVLYVSHGEQSDQMTLFDPSSYVQSLLG